MFDIKFHDFKVAFKTLVEMFNKIFFNIKHKQSLYYTKAVCHEANSFLLSFVSTECGKIDYQLCAY